MRDIKFRAWGHLADRLHRPYAIFYNLSGFDKYMVPYTNELPICDHNLMQYTGLKDKNGVEIYEGDVIEVELDKERAFTNGEKDVFRLKVYYGADASFHALRIGSINDLYCINFGGSAVRRFEVIGNIHENPELLGETA